jgi:exodeoxyribonuclease VII large subunit
MLIFPKIEKFKNLYQYLNKNMELRLIDYKTKLFQLENSYILSNPSILYKFKEQKLIGLIEKLEVLNPLNTLKRGYTIVRSNDKVVSDINCINKDDELEVEFKNGKVVTKVVKVGDK